MEGSFIQGMFDQHGSFLEERMNPDSGLLDKLLSNKTLTRIELDDIKDHRPFYRRNAQLLNYIRQKNKYDSLIGALKDTRQTHLVNYLTENGEYKSEYGGDWPLTEYEMSILDTNQESLVDLVDCNDLLVRLFSAQVINGRQRETISAEPTNHRRNEVLLDVLRRRSVDDYRWMVRCLHESNQSHIANLLDKGGVVARVRAELGTSPDAIQTEDEIVARFTDILSGKSLDEASRLLKEIELRIIAAKKGHSVFLYVYCRTATELTDLREMDSSGKLKGAVEQLFSQLLLSSVALDAEVTVENLGAVVECAFTQLLYRSQIARLTVALPPNEYKKCRSYFSDDCNIVRAVCDLDPRRMGRKEYEELKKTVRRSAKVEGHPYSMALSFKKGDYMVTTAPANIGDKDEWWKVEHLGNGKIGYIPRNCVVIDYSQEVRTTSRNFVIRRRTSTTKASSTTTVNELPLELLDIILRKSYLHYLLSRNRSKDQSDQFLIVRLSTVELVWFDRIRKRRFKRCIWRHLSAVFKRVDRIIVILRNNESFFVENVQRFVGQMDQLRSSDGLTDVEARLLSRRTVNSGKTKLVGRNNRSDLLHVVRSCNDARRSACIRCLRQSNQKLITKVVENGGVVLKVKLWSKDADKLKQLSEKMSDLRDKTKERSDKIERAISRLRDNDIEIISCQLDRQVTLWIWCQSQTHLETLRSFFESNCIGDVIGDLTKIIPLGPECFRSGAIDTDADQFKKTVVVCPIVVKFTVRLGVNEDEEVKGVTKLREEIYVLCRTDSSSPHVIRVFQNRNPFRLNAKIEISEIDDPEDIGSSEQKNCVYVIDSKQKCVWKITRQAANHRKVIDWQPTELQLPSTLSVSSDGQLLMVSRESSLSVLKVFGPDAELRLCIRLPSDIEEPRHAVETSSGDFVVLHSLGKDVEVGSGAEERKRMFVVSKVTRDGQMVVSRFTPQNKTQDLSCPSYLALDSNDGVFVADEGRDRVILLGSNLSWNRIVCPTEDEGKGISLPKRLCYDEVERQLIVAGFFRREGVNIYSFF